MGETLRAAAGYCRVAGASDVFYSAPVIRSRADELVQPVSHREKLPCRGCTANCLNRDRCDGKPWRIPRSRSLEKLHSQLSQSGR